MTKYYENWDQNVPGVKELVDKIKTHEVGKALDGDRSAINYNWYRGSPSCLMCKHSDYIFEGGQAQNVCKRFEVMAVRVLCHQARNDLCTIEGIFYEPKNQ